MERIHLHDKTFRICIPHSDIQKSIEVLAAKMNKDFEGKEKPLFVSVLNGSFMFTSDLLKNLTFQCELSFIKVSSYAGTSSTGEIKEIMGLTSEVKGRSVIIVEDIVDTGATIVELHKMLTDKGAAEVNVCTLLLKPEAYKKDVNIKYVAMEIPNDFIVGYGLDYDELGRQYKDIYVLDTSGE
ncbi:MAG: hypoxanthine phosphoribosyltransferase [Bacteroidetes bacterium HGW-Bacteroidetes-14]|jgi:hypoxanthine phosphoribosyltransferase|nr:MAG: hypoxanthine phosphoribosyltransferase [Bacteroidetes bacterium HGW-Bacteroidetes-14]